MSEESKTTSDNERIWEDHEHQQLLRLLKLSLPEKLQWLEDAQKMVDQLQRSASQPRRPVR